MTATKDGASKQAGLLAPNEHKTGTLIPNYNAVVNSLPPQVLISLEWGRPVFPCNVEKKPLVKWKELQSRMPTVDEMREWLGLQPSCWASVRGAISRVFTLDFDGEHGVNRMRAWGLNPHRQTGSGGYHVDVAMPAWHVKTLNAKTDEWLAENYKGVDIRADGGYAIIHGKNESGDYITLRGPTPDSLDEVLDRLPPELAEHLGLLHPPTESAIEEGESPTSAVPSAMSVNVSANSHVAAVVVDRDGLAEATFKKGLDFLRSGIGRDNACFMMACQFRDNGFTQAETDGYGPAFLSHCPPTNTKGVAEPFTLKDYYRKVSSAYSRAPRDPWARPTVEVEVNDDAAAPTVAEPLSAAFIWECFEAQQHGDARLLRQLYQGRLCYDPVEKAWYVFRGHAWERDLLDVAKHAVPTTVAAVYLKLAAQVTASAKGSDDDEVKKAQKEADALIGRAKKLRHMPYTRGVVEFCQGLLGIDNSQWDAQPWLLGTANGVVDLRTGEHRPGRPDDMLRVTAPTEWHGLDAPAPRWEQFIREILCEDGPDCVPVLAPYMRRLLGYAITGLTVEHVLPIFSGSEGRNGKDTLFATLTHVLGQLITSTSTDVFLQGRRTTNAATPFLAEMQGKRIVWASETNEDARLNSGQVKLLTGGGEIRARWLNANPIRFAPTHLLVLITNRKPSAPSDDRALWSRIQLVDFTRRFVDEPKADNERKADKHLVEALKGEAPGILAWLVRGCLEWQVEGLNPPESVKMATEQYREAEDELAQFIKECCEEGPNAKVKAGELLAAFADWRGVKTTQRELSRLLKGKYDKTPPTRTGIYYLGIGLLTKESVNREPSEA